MSLRIKMISHTRSGEMMLRQFHVVDSFSPFSHSGHSLYLCFSSFQILLKKTCERFRWKHTKHQNQSVKQKTQHYMNERKIKRYSLTRGHTHEHTKHTQTNNTTLHQTELHEHKYWQNTFIWNYQMTFSTSSHSTWTDSLLMTRSNFNTNKPYSR